MSEIKDTVKERLDNTLEMAIEQEKTKKIIETFGSGGHVVGDWNPTPINIMISGPTGVGKTARIQTWADDQTDLNFVVFNAAILRVNKIVSDGIEYDVVFSSDEIDSICKGNTVVFIDNYQYIESSVEHELNKFFDTRSLVDPRTPEGIRIAGKVLFAVVATTE